MQSSRWWEAHYRAGGASGEGSVGDLRAWKWDKIGEVSEVLDYGCGDLTFWDGRYEAPGEVRYTGIDPSPTIITKDQRKRPAWTFYTLDEWLHFAGWENRHDTALCLDVLFHIVEDEEYDRALGRVFMYAKRRVVIYTWRDNPFSRRHAAREIMRGASRLQAWRVREWLPYLLKPRDGDGVFQKWRPLGTVFEKAHLFGFRATKVWNAPDGVGVLINFEAERVKE